MRTQILETDSDGSRVMVVTSCEEGDYVTGIADDIALSAGRASIDVTLVSAHVHPTRSSVAHWARAEPGLSSVLLGECPLDAAVITGPVTTVHLLSAGRSLSYPEALLTSKAMVDVVDDLQSRGSALLIDAPPLLAPPDTLGLVRATGAGVLLVVHAGRYQASGAAIGHPHAGRGRGHSGGCRVRAPAGAARGARPGGGTRPDRAAGIGVHAYSPCASGHVMSSPSSAPSPPSHDRAHRAHRGSRRWLVSSGVCCTRGRWLARCVTPPDCS